MIGVRSAKWMERPMACVVLKEGETMTYDELIEHLTPLMAKVQSAMLPSWVSASQCLLACSGGCPTQWS